MKKHVSYPTRINLDSCERALRGGVGSLTLVLLSTLLLGCDDPKTEVKPTTVTQPLEPKPLATSMPKAPEPVAVPAKAKKKLEDCPSGNSLTIESPGLEASIRVKAQKPEGDLTKADLKKLRSLNLSRVELNELDICLFSQMTELRELFIAPSGIDDLTPLSYSKKIETLGIAGNPVSDLTPLAEMKNMDRLDLAKTQVADLAPLSKMTKLTELTLDGSAVTDLSGISGLTKLERLSIKSTAIKDIKLLAEFKALQFLYLADSAAASDIGQTGALVQNGTKVIQD